MFSINTARAVIAAIALAPIVTEAQSTSALVGWVGLVTTPVGAFAPVITGRPASGNRSFGVQARTSQWRFAEGDDETRNIGLGALLNRGRTRTVFELGTMSKKGCDQCGGIMAGVDMQVDLAHTSKGGPTYLIAANPAVGYFKPKEGGGHALTAALSLPMSASINTGNSVRLVPYLSPGFGVARLAAQGDSENGTRGMLAGGLSLGGQRSSWLVTASARKIFMEEAPTIYGIGMSFAR